VNVEKAKDWIKQGDVRFVKGKWIKPIKIVYDGLNRPWLKCRYWFIEPAKATRQNICNAEGICYIPLF